MLAAKQRAMVLHERVFIYLKIQSWFPVTKNIKQIQKPDPGSGQMQGLRENTVPCFQSGLGPSALV